MNENSLYSSLKIINGHESLILFCFLAVVSVVGYLLAPDTYVWGYDCYCCINFVVSFVLFCLVSKKKNYFDPEVLFLLSFFFVFFVYSVFLYPISPQYFVVFAYSFNMDVISKCTGMALMGAEMYMFGAVICQHRWNHKENKPETKDMPSGPMPTKLLLFFSLVPVIMFFVFGGFTSLNNAYGNIDSGTGSPIAIFASGLMSATLIAGLVFEFNKVYWINPLRFEWKKLNLLYFLVCISTCFIIIVTGSRTFTLQYLLASLALYSFLYRPIKLKAFIILFIMGVVSMFFISSTRSGGSFQLTGIFDIFMDLIINNRNSFTAYEYVEINGYSYGETMLSYIFRIVPMLQGMMAETFNLNPKMLRSATLLTAYTLGEDSKWGLGTNIIADLYLAFGSLGVGVGMSLFGFFVRKSAIYAKRRHIYYTCLYCLFAALSVYGTRGEFFYGLAYLVWMFLFVNIARHFYYKRRGNCKTEFN